MLDCKVDETASVDSSEGICETLVPCNEPEAEKVPQVEKSPKDKHWSNFKEDVPMDSPSQHLPEKDFFLSASEAFENNFKSILYSSCDNYDQWIAEGAELMQSAEQLNGKVC